MAAHLTAVDPDAAVVVYGGQVQVGGIALILSGHVKGAAIPAGALVVGVVVLQVPVTGHRQAVPVLRVLQGVPPLGLAHVVGVGGKGPQAVEGQLHLALAALQGRQGVQVLLGAEGKGELFAHGVAHHVGHSSGHHRRIDAVGRHGDLRGEEYGAAIGVVRVQGCGGGHSLAVLLQGDAGDGGFIHRRAEHHPHRSLHRHPHVLFQDRRQGSGGQLHRKGLADHRLGQAVSAGAHAGHLDGIGAAGQIGGAGPGPIRHRSGNGAHGLLTGPDGHGDRRGALSGAGDGHGHGGDGLLGDCHGDNRAAHRAHRQVVVLDGALHQPDACLAGDLRDFITPVHIGKELLSVGQAGDVGAVSLYRQLHSLACGPADLRAGTGGPAAAVILPQSGIAVALQAEVPVGVLPHIPEHDTGAGVGRTGDVDLSGDAVAVLLRQSRGKQQGARAALALALEHMVPLRLHHGVAVCVAGPAVQGTVLKGVGSVRGLLGHPEGPLGGGGGALLPCHGDGDGAAAGGQAGYGIGKAAVLLQGQGDLLPAVDLDHRRQGVLRGAGDHCLGGAHRQQRPFVRGSQLHCRRVLHRSGQGADGQVVKADPAAPDAEAHAGGGCLGAVIGVSVVDDLGAVHIAENMSSLGGGGEGIGGSGLPVKGGLGQLGHGTAGILIELGILAVHVAGVEAEVEKVLLSCGAEEQSGAGAVFHVDGVHRHLGGDDVVAPCHALGGAQAQGAPAVFRPQHAVFHGVAPRVGPGGNGCRVLKPVLIQGLPCLRSGSSCRHSAQPAGRHGHGQQSAEHAFLPC
ncbi:Uncharacterised protein [uncultured Flavonifractor sp.]|nr:Uncharacterised protein [uncultured Flavonifractor sp.]